MPKGGAVFGPALAALEFWLFWTFVPPGYSPGNSTPGFTLLTGVPKAPGSVRSLLAFGSLLLSQPTKAIASPTAKRIFFIEPPGKQEAAGENPDRFLNATLLRYGDVRELLLPLLLGELLGALELDELPAPCAPLLLFEFKLFVELGAPDGSLMLLPLLRYEPLRPALEPVVSVPWSLLQPTNNAAAPTIANSFFIIVTFLLQTVSSRERSLNG